MSLPIALDNEYIRAAAIASYKASLVAAEKDELDAQEAVELAEKKLREATAMVSAFKILLGRDKVESFTPKGAEGSPNDEDEELDNPSHLVAKRRRTGGIDATTLAQAKEKAIPLTSDEIVRLVEKAYPEPISHKSVRNALGEFVKKGVMTKQYSKEQQAYLYAVPELLEENPALEDEQPENEQVNDTAKEGTTNEKAEEPEDLDLGF